MYFSWSVSSTNAMEFSNYLLANKNQTQLKYIYIYIYTYMSVSNSEWQSIFLIISLNAKYLISNFTYKSTRTVLKPIYKVKKIYLNIIIVTKFFFVLGPLALVTKFLLLNSVWYNEV